ncbi:hypothetical protein [Klebsiella variicola]|uniref:hypothetical protein n=1 Tax=Klebsiella variicola TaxID=244366 RepID=UPI0021C27E0D|nr:hypothetical protein [Klebsiella variicola]
MTSKLTRERLQEIAEDGFLKHGESKELARMVLAAMDSEPVAWTWHYREQWHVTNDKRRAEFVAKDGDVSVLPLYRHAQPAPVVPEEMTIRDACKFVQDMRLFDDVSVIVMRTWNACRATMLQELKKSAGTEATCRSNENALVLNTIKAPPALDSLPKTGEVQNTNYPENPGCWCRTCRPVVLNDMRFVVCPDCGNKRCPRANDHRNACTGSNEPGQEGSAFPDTPREVKGE